MSEPAYLGDGLYVRFENLQIILLANDSHTPTDQVCIEWPDVWQRLQTFVNARAKYGSPAAQTAAWIDDFGKPQLPEISLSEDLPPTDPIDVDDLNDVLGKWGTLLAGYTVIWNGEDTGILKFVDTAPVIEMPLKCADCGCVSEPFHIREGAPGWCYAYSLEGQLLADLRNQEWVCEECTEKRTAISK